MVVLLLSMLMIPTAFGGGNTGKEGPPRLSEGDPPPDVPGSSMPGSKVTTPTMELTGLPGKVSAQLSMMCNCAKKPSFEVSTTDQLITIQGVMPDGPLARCVEPCTLFAEATGLSPGKYRVVYLPDDASEPTFSGVVEVH